MLRVKRFSGVLLALAVGGLVACGEGDPTGLAGGGSGGGGSGGGGTGTSSGTFEATVTGAASLDMDGDAFWGEVDDSQLGEVFVLVFGDDSSGQVLGSVSLYLGGTRPATGTYQVLDMDESAENPFVNTDFVALVVISQPPLLGTSLSGEVEITSSSSGEVAGTFTVRAQAIGQSGSGSEVTVSGSFRAIGGPVFLPE